MKKVTIFFKSGNKLVFKCKSFNFTIKETKKILTIEGEGMDWMIDANEMEAYTVKTSFWY